jgi:hypothetical protein
LKYLRVQRVVDNLDVAIQLVDKLYST